jgi:hypothetical protein
MTILAANGRPTATWSICLFTDGIPNSGANTATALANAQSNGLDGFGVVAIEDPPNALEADFQLFYGPLVFGGGGLLVVRNATEFANAVGLVCLVTSEARLVGLEAVQTIQDWQDSIMLVKDKPTIVRAHFEPVSGTSSVVSARLHGKRNGIALNGSPLTPMSPGFLIARPNAASRRDSLTASLNFRLPTDWLNGTVSLEVEGFGTALDCADAADTANDCMVEVSFQEVPEPEVRFVAVNWTQSGTTHTTTTAHLDELEQRLAAIYPVSGIDRSDATLTLTGTPDTIGVNNRLFLMRLLDGCILGCDRLYYGAYRDTTLGGRASGIPGNQSNGQMPTASLTYGRNRQAHEINHNLGSYHVTFCNASAPMPPMFPAENTINFGGMAVATIGPMTLGINPMVYGLDNHRMKVVDPNENFELMSYCGSRTTPRLWRWVSDFTYHKLITDLDSRFSRRATAPGYNWMAGIQENLHQADQYQARPGFTIDRTPPVINRANITEGFDDITNLPGWAAVNNSDVPGTSDWFQGNNTVFSAQAGSPTSYIGANFNNTAGTVISNWLMTPVLDLSTFESLSFWTRTTTASEFPDRLEVRLSDSGSSTNVGSSPTSVGDFTDLLIAINPALQVGEYPDVWTQFTINRADLPVVGGSGRVAFRYYVTDAGPLGVNSDYIGIDSFSYVESSGPTTEYILCRGVIDLTNPSTTFLPFQSIEPQNPLPTPVPGAYDLRVFDGNNQMLANISFQVTETHADIGSQGSGEDPQQASFLVPVPYDPDMSRVEVYFNNNLIGSRTGSGSRPDTVVTFPNGGEVISSDMVTLSWNASDPDPGDLTYTVRYSRDQGNSWRTLAVDLENNSFTLPRRFLQGSNQAMIRVTTSDGFHVGGDNSNSLFSVANNSPGMELQSPRDFSRYIGVELVHLNGVSHDPEDGQLAPTSIAFVSNRDGFLGFSGGTVNAADLSEGIHTLTATATDSDGATSTQSVTIVVTRIGALECGAIINPVVWPVQTVLDLVDTLNQFCGNP